MADIVIREVTKDVWIFSKPFHRFGIIPFGGRSTAIKLSDGNVWVLASTPLSPETKETLDELGPVKYIVAADAVHWMFLKEFKQAYPEAKLIGVQPHIQKKELAELKFDGAYGHDADGTTYGFENDIKACYFSGFQNKDVAFFHPASKSLIEADLLLNLPPTEQFSKAGSGYFPFANHISPGTWLHQRFLGGVTTDKAAMRRDAKTVAGWDFNRIIPCHGDVIEETGKKAWEDTYKSFLQ